MLSTQTAERKPFPPPYPRLFASPWYLRTSIGAPLGLEFISSHDLPDRLCAASLEIWVGHPWHVKRSVSYLPCLSLCSSCLEGLSQEQWLHLSFADSWVCWEDNSEALKSIDCDRNDNYPMDFTALYILATYCTLISAAASSGSPMKQAKQERRLPFFFRLKTPTSKKANHFSREHVMTPR